MAGGGRKHHHHAPVPSHGMGYTHKTYNQFFADVLEGLGITNLSKQQLIADEHALASVAHFEGLNNRYNPLNSVVPYGTSTAFNSVGVQDYKNYTQGVLGTEKLLKQSNWSGVVGALRQGNESNVLNQFDVMYQSWGSNGPVAISEHDAAQIGRSKIGTGPSWDPNKGSVGQAGNPLTNGILGAGGAVGGATGNAINAITSPFEILKALYNDMTSTDFWIRIGFVILGFIILLIGIDKLSNGSISGSSGGSASGTIDVVTETAGNAAQTTGNTAKAGAEKVKTHVKAHTYQPKHGADKSAAGNATPGSKQGKKQEKKSEHKQERHKAAAEAAEASA